MENKAKVYKMEDTFWPGKKELIPDYSVMLKIYQQALKAPTDLKYKPDDLVNYLLKGAKTEVERVRVLVRWIGDNIAYDIKGRDEGNADCTFEGVLRSGKAVCEGYAVVVSMFCQKANIECRKISGQTKNGEMKYKEIRQMPKSTHAWNQIKINGKWFFVDSTWCAGGTGKVFTKKWNEGWFLTDPEAFIWTHLPMRKDGGISSEDQMIAKPYSSSAVWDTPVYRSPYSCGLGFQPINYPNTHVTVKDSTITLKYNCKPSLDHYVIACYEDTKAQLENQWNMVYERNGVVTANIRFPGPGVYHIDVMSKVKFNKGEDEILVRCFQYRVVNTGGKMDPFPSPYGWGERENFRNAGFRLTNPVSPISIAENGVARIKVKLPSAGIVPNLFNLVKPDLKSNTDTKLNDHVFAEKKEKIARYYLQCPTAGEYRFELFIKDNKEKSNFSGGAFVFVVSNKKKASGFLQPKDMQSQLPGPDAEFYKLGFTTNRKSSTIHFEGDKAVLHIKKTKEAYVSAHLKSAADENAEGLLDKKETEEDCIITVKEPQVPGFYWIELFGGSERYGSKPYIGSFCVPYKIPFLKN